MWRVSYSVGMGMGSLQYLTLRYRELRKVESYGETSLLVGRKKLF